jgi:hypothetical protein
MVEPNREKTIVAAVNRKTAGAFSPTESETVLTESEPDPDISIASLETAIEDINSKPVVSGDAGKSASNKSFNIAADAANLGNLQGESAEPMTQPEADSGLSAPITTGDSGTNSEKVASETIEMSGSRKLASGVVVPNHVVTPQTKESKVSANISKSETDNSIATPRLANGEVARENAASKNAAVPISRAPAIAVTDFEAGRIFQRKGLSADIVVSGTYTGLLEAIEARVVRDSTFEEIVPWTVIESSPRNGIFVGILPDVPQGGWYNIQVRSTQDHSVSARGAHKWGVGMLVACLGQSNMKEWFYTGTSLSAHALLRKFSGSGWSAPGRRGNAAIAFGNRIIDRLGIPVGLLDYSVNGSGLRKEADWGTGYWEDTAPGSIYNRFITGLTAVGGALESVIWIQGEADAARGTVTEDEYRTSLTSFIKNQLRTDIHNGSDRESLPILLVMMIKRPGGKDEPHQAIRNAQKQVAENVKNCYLAATTLDLKNQGRQHLTSDAYMILGRRVAQTVLYILGLETYYRGPTVADVKRLDNRTIDIVIQHRGGTDFTPRSGITGWEVLSNGSPVPIAEVHRRDSQTIRIFLKDPLAEKAKILYLCGAMPDSTRPVLDNSAMRLPLEECQSEIN